MSQVKLNIEKQRTKIKRINYKDENLLGDRIAMVKDKREKIERDKLLKFKNKIEKKVDKNTEKTKE